MSRITIQDIINSKKQTNEKLLSDLQKLIDCDITVNSNKQCGNKILYHFQLENLLNVKTQRKLLKDILENDYINFEKIVIKLRKTISANNFFEAYRFNQSVVFFKPITAKYIYNYYKGTHILDPTAGWGGRMLGAHSLGINYTGIDSNLSLQKGYDGIMELLNDNKMKMIWGDSLEIPFEDIDYDLVLTSPPYFKKNKLIEIYEYQKMYNNFYDDFLIPLLKKCLKYIKRNGKVCFNINKEMYDVICIKFKPANECIDLLQQKKMGRNRNEKIYVWF